MYFDSADLSKSYDFGLDKQEKLAELAILTAKKGIPVLVSNHLTDFTKEIYKEALLKEGKPENILDKIIAGKIGKYYEEVCLNKQEFVKDDKKKIEEILGNIKVEKFIRYSL